MVTPTDFKPPWAPFGAAGSTIVINEEQVSRQVWNVNYIRYLQYLGPSQEALV